MSRMSFVHWLVTIFHILIHNDKGNEYFLLVNEMKIYISKQHRTRPEIKKNTDETDHIKILLHKLHEFNKKKYNH